MLNGAHHILYSLKLMLAIHLYIVVPTYAVQSFGHVEIM